MRYLVFGLLNSASPFPLSFSLSNARVLHETPRKVATLRKPPAGISTRLIYQAIGKQSLSGKRNETGQLGKTAPKSLSRPTALEEVVANMVIPQHRTPHFSPGLDIWALGCRNNGTSVSKKRNILNRSLLDLRSSGGRFQADQPSIKAPEGIYSYAQVGE
jgi:hypothetical protein